MTHLHQFLLATAGPENVKAAAAAKSILPTATTTGRLTSVVERAGQSLRRVHQSHAKNLSTSAKSLAKENAKLKQNSMDGAAAQQQAQMEMQIEAQKAKMEHELEREKMHAEAERNKEQQKIDAQMQQEKAKTDMALTQQKAQLDAQIAQQNAEAQAKVEQQRMQAEAQALQAQGQTGPLPPASQAPYAGMAGSNPEEEQQGQKVQ